MAQPKKDMDFGFYDNGSVLVPKRQDVNIDFVLVEGNSTILPDKILAQRISMIPIISGQVEKKLIYRTRCPCKAFCQKCSIQFKLDVEGGQNEARYVTTDEFDSSQYAALPKGFIFLYLKKRERVKLTAYASKSCIPKDGMRCIGNATISELPKDVILYSEFKKVPATNSIEPMDVTESRRDDEDEKCICSSCSLQ